MDSTGLVLWTIHKPIRGWYLIIRSPSYSNPHTHIALQPLKLCGPEHDDRFIFRLKPLHIPSDGLPSASNDEPLASPLKSPPDHLISPVDSAPMSLAGSGESLERNTSADSGDADAPEIVVPSSSSPDQSINQRLSSDDSSSSTSLPRPPQLSTDPDSPHFPSSSTSQLASTSATGAINELDFLLRPSEPEVPLGTFSRILSFFGEPSKSFCCLRPGSPTIMSFEDQTSMFNLETKGELKIWLEPVSQYQMPLAFWVTVALAYLGYRDDKEAYLAATEDIQ
ncbi:hypothetical protein CROQUDRAFT_673012 [Cronartium quercuum f. sp. fusiforme G11]|uniref:Uncharacterized protein n=1 Tax=Cronartium quercuum f. sp. fusiforme G11 TaxID=708437 RepID=A0A9P6NFS1_9BASI|nr:hypothetical protein CROQUDRAFT_673012 [Cronartium quercuum f. sp. fusiforme G11]